MHTVKLRKAHEAAERTERSELNPLTEQRQQEQERLQGERIHPDGSSVPSRERHGGDAAVPAAVRGIHPKVNAHTQTPYLYAARPASLFLFLKEFRFKPSHLRAQVHPPPTHTHTLPLRPPSAVFCSSPGPLCSRCVFTLGVLVFVSGVFGH